MDPSPPSPPPPRHGAPAPSGGLGAELRESLVLLGLAVGVTMGITTVAQAALTALS